MIDFFNAQKRYIGESCLKYSIKEEKDYLQIESKILSLLYSNNILCPVIIDTGSRNGFSYILMETIKGDCLSNKIIDIKIANLVFDAIHQHESVLLDNIEILKQLGLFSDLSKEIDFESKLVSFLQKITPNFTIKKQLDFLNHHLNQPDVIAKRRIITDRSAENIFIDENNQLIMIDFSTVRIGTQFENWIQFIDCPHAKFSCTKKGLFDLLFEKMSMQKDDINLYYVSAIYVNLLQGIFTHKKDRQLSTQYINNVNTYFQKFTKKKGVLIEINH